LSGAIAGRPGAAKAVGLLVKWAPNAGTYQAAAAQEDLKRQFVTLYGTRGRYEGFEAVEYGRKDPRGATTSCYCRAIGR